MRKFLNILFGWMRKGDTFPVRGVYIGEGQSKVAGNVITNNDLILMPIRQGKTVLDERIAQQAVDAGASFVVTHERQAQLFAELTKQSKNP